MITLRARHANIVPDKTDKTLAKIRQDAWLKTKVVKCGDYIIFADGTERRVSYVWYDGNVQSSNVNEGSWYLGIGGAEMSGSLYGSVPSNTLVLTDKLKPAWFWFFHHDQSGNSRGVDVSINVHVWRCSENPPN